MTSDAVVRQLAHKLATMERRLRDMETASQASLRSIEGGSIDVYDDDTDELLGRIGVQPDGTVGVDVRSGAKPETPTVPDVNPIPGGAIVAWDGRFEEAQSMKAIDRIAVHMDEEPDFVTSRDTEMGAIYSHFGGTTVIPMDDGTDWYVKLIAVSKGGVESDPSEEVHVPAVGAEISFWQDPFTLTQAGPQDLILTYRPIPGSEHVYWNGIYQPEDESWTREDSVVSLLATGFAPVLGDQIVVEYAYDDSGSRRTTIQIVASNHENDLELTFILPDGTRYPVPGANTPGAGPVIEFGSFVLDDMKIEFADHTYSQVWTYPENPDHIRRVPISGTDAAGSYSGYRYSFDDMFRGVPDGDFNDLVMDVKSYV